MRTIRQAGHEVASHGWDHRRIHVMTPAAFRDDVRTSKDALEQTSGAAVLGYRCSDVQRCPRRRPGHSTFLASRGCSYDSSIYPVYHDRYGSRMLQARRAGPEA